MAEEGIRALIIDGNTDNKVVMADLIHAMGHIPVEACSHNRATALLRSRKFDLFLVNLDVPLSENGKPQQNFGIILIDQIRNYHPHAQEFPIIAFNHTLLDYEELCDVTEAGANTYLAFSSGDPKDITKLTRAIIRLVEKAISKRKTKPIREPDVNTEDIQDERAGKFKLFVDLDVDKAYFKGVELPSGKNGLQLRHRVFLFILAKNPGRAMSHEEIHHEIRNLKLNDFDDPPKNIRNQVRKTIRELIKRNHGKITETDLRAFIKTIRPDKTILTLSKEDVCAIYGDKEYPLL